MQASVAARPLLHQNLGNQATKQGWSSKAGVVERESDLSLLILFFPVCQ